MSLHELGQFITDHPLFTFGLFVLTFVFIVGLFDALGEAAKSLRNK
jgi:hypothetical protein